MMIELPVCIDETNGTVIEVARARYVIWTDRAPTTAAHDLVFVCVW